MLALAISLASGCPSLRPSVGPVELNGVRLERLTPRNLPSGPRAEARPGDFLLENQRLRVVVAAVSPPPRARAGVLVDATALGWEDDRLTGLEPAIEIEGTRRELVTHAVEADVARDVPVIVIVAETRDRRVKVTTRVALSPGARWVRLTSEIENRAPSPLRVRFGDRLRSYGQAAFVPGIGKVEDTREVVGAWFAHAGRKQSYALVFPERPATIQVQRLAMGGSEETAFGPALELPAGALGFHARRLVVARGGLEAAALDALEALGEPFGFVAGKLEPAPRFARIDAQDELGRLVLSGEARAGRFTLPLPVGSYELTLHVPGGVDRQKVEVVPRGTTRPAFLVPTPARLTYRVVDEEERRLPARLVFTGVSPSVNPDLGPLHSARGAANVLCSATGEGSVELPPGRYSVLATHGPEFDVVESTVDVSSSEGATFRARLRRSVKTDDWVAADLHLHADPSGDSEVPLEDRVTALLAEGVEVAAATDHNHVTDYAPAVQTLGAQGAIDTAPGIEVTTSEFGHFNAYPYPIGAELPPAYEAPPRTLLPWIREHAPGAVIQVNHPRMGDIGYFNRIELDEKGASPNADASLDFDAIEVWNGFDLTVPEATERMLTEWMRLLRQGRRYAAVGNSDSHRIAYQWAGYPRTFLYTGEGPRDEPLFARAMRGLRAGRAVVSSGPFIALSVDGEMPGGATRAVEGHARIELEVRAPAWITLSRAELWANGKLALSVDASVADAARGVISFTGSLPILEDTFLIVIARGSSSLARVLPGADVTPMAFTNPVFIRAATMEPPP